MSSTQRLELRQGQTLTMTPQLLQSIKLLQLSHLELAAFVDAELERNPLLQHADEMAQDGPPDGKARAAQAERVIRRIFPQAGARHPQGLVSSKTGQASGSVPSEAGGDLEATQAGTVSLTDHLEAQLDLATADPLLRDTGRYVIHSLSETGYLADDVAEIASGCGASEDAVLRALALVQSFDPPGIAARTLSECLTIQLRERGRLDRPMETLLARLDLVARRDYAALRRLCDLDEEALAAKLSELRSLEPKPGLAFTVAPVDALVPDVFVRPQPDGSFHLELNATTMPRLLVDRTYQAQVSGHAMSKADQLFVSDCVRSATWLARSLDQRATTILKVATEIVGQQGDFFRHGAGHLRPMTLRAVAEAIGMHESTISRVTANKAVGTPAGTFPMKYFFSSALSGADGAEAQSSEAVRHRIKALIAAETRAAVLSDDAIAQRLKATGVDIARRTVAKYRESLRIPASAHRRRLNRRMTGPVP
ncbi:RNA polymerase factor sigma-54 [Microvirga antarctica]|uniref:RNA polymerase factor sigma-54 n=1 Tax=Microvirga antarctica TaxID=2819233 RepID=UPI001B30E945|nr:RNA polymerase factor sigma-54 [Microvirga antarctica]